LVYAIIEGPRHGWLTVESLLWFGSAAVVLGFFVWWEWRNRHPMLELRLFRNPRFAVSAGGITLVFFAMFGTFFMLAQYLQGVLDYSPLGAAVRMLPFSAVMMTVAPQTPRLVARFGADRIGAAGLLFVSAGLLGTSFFQTDTGYPQLAITMCVLAGGMALTMTPMTTQLMAAVPRDRAGMGSATNDTTRELGGALGVAVLGSVLASQYTSGIAPAVAGLPAEMREVAEGSVGGVKGLIENGVIAGDQAASVLSTAKEAFVDGLTLAALLGAVVTIIAAVLVKRFLPSDRLNSEVTGQPERAAAIAD
jgi:predicted MFS family arabinose efflux permease